MRRFSSMLIVGFISLLGIVLGAVFGYLPNLYPNLFTDRPWLFWSIVGGIILVLAGSGLSEWKHANSGTPDTTQAERNRRTLLEKVHHIWINGVLNASLYKATLIALNLHARPRAITPPLDIMIRQPGQADQPLPPGQRISQVFDDVGGALLILGAPGAGKTTLLLELARDLIDRAGSDPQHPIPVIFPLSTWAAHRRPLAEWLVDELVQRYDVPRKLAQAWLADDAILPLLDGLDEVVPDARDACVAAINTFRASRGRLPMAVCSRITDYDELTIKLHLHGAIIAQPLNRDQVRQYIRDIGFPFTPSSTSPLWKLLETPLMLHVATFAYAGLPPEHIPTTGAGTDIQDQLLAAYVERRLSQFSPSFRYSAAQTKLYLSWLAWQMQQHNQTVFYLERMQPDWLPVQYRLVLRLVYGLFIVLMSALIGGLIGVLSGNLALNKHSCHQGQDRSGSAIHQNCFCESPAPCLVSGEIRVMRPPPHRWGCGAACLSE